MWSIWQVSFRCMSTRIQRSLVVGQALACQGRSREPRQAKPCPTKNLPDAPVSIETKAETQAIRRYEAVGHSGAEEWVTGAFGWFVPYADLVWAA